MFSTTLEPIDNNPDIARLLVLVPLFSDLFTSDGWPTTTPDRAQTRPPFDVSQPDSFPSTLWYTQGFFPWLNSGAWFLDELERQFVLLYWRQAASHLTRPGPAGDLVTLENLGNLNKVVRFEDNRFVWHTPGAVMGRAGRLIREALDLKPLIIDGYHTPDAGDWRPEDGVIQVGGYGALAFVENQRMQSWHLSARAAGKYMVIQYLPPERVDVGGQILVGVTLLVVAWSTLILGAYGITAASVLSSAATIGAEAIGAGEVTALLATMAELATTLAEIYAVYEVLQARWDEAVTELRTYNQLRLDAQARVGELSVEGMRADELGAWVENARRQFPPD